MPKTRRPKHRKHIIAAAALASFMLTNNATAHTSWTGHPRYKAFEQADHLRDISGQLVKKISMLKEPTLGEVLKLVREHKEFTGLIVNGNSIGFTTRVYKNGSTQEEFPMLIRFEVSMTSAEKLRKVLNDGKELSGVEPMTFFALNDLRA